MPKWYFVQRYGLDLTTQQYVLWYHLWPFCRYSHCLAGLLCSVPDEALLTPARTKSITINCTNCWGRSQGCGTTPLTCTLRKERGCPPVLAAWVPLGTKSPALPLLSEALWLRPSPCLGDLCEKKSNGGGSTSLWASPLILSWHQGNREGCPLCLEWRCC